MGHDAREVDFLASFLFAPTVRALPKGERLLIIGPGEGFAFEWNQTVFAAPMFLLYLVSIGIAWLVEPRDAGRQTNWHHTNSLGWGVLAAVAVYHARRHKRLASCS